MKLVSPSGRAEVRVDAGAGGRLASLEVDGHELLVGDTGNGPLSWGCYPMVPWAGRLDRGRFRFDGVDHRLEIDAPPHAIHGVGYRRAWHEVSPGRLQLALGNEPAVGNQPALGKEPAVGSNGWPLGGVATIDLDLDDDRLRLTLGVRAEGRAMPAVLGWHPWFRRQLRVGGPAELGFSPGWMWRRGTDGLPDGTRVPAPTGPWDDAFGGVSAPPTLRWPGVMVLTLESDAPVWVVYDEPEHAICVEPQSDVPDALNHDPVVLPPGETLTLTLTMNWRRDG